MRAGEILLRRCGFTATLVSAVIIVALFTGTLRTPASDMHWYVDVATGVPAFAEGHWWTLFTAPFFLETPVTLLLIAPLLVGGLGFAEWRLGTGRTITVFVGGHIVGVLGTSLMIVALTPLNWSWIVELANTRDVGPSCGAFASFAFSLATLPAPWRLRTRVTLGAWAAIEVLYIGELTNVEHATAIAAGLLVSGMLPAYRRRLSRPSTREWGAARYSCGVGGGGAARGTQHRDRGFWVGTGSFSLAFQDH